MKLMIGCLTGARMWVRDDLVPIHLAAGDRLVAEGPAGPAEAVRTAGEAKDTGTAGKTPAKSQPVKRAASSGGKKTTKKTVKKPARKTAAKKTVARKPVEKVDNPPKEEPMGEGDGEW